MHIVFHFLMLLVVISSAAFCEIFEVENFNEILKHVEPETLVILDIDDTLLIPIQTLGGDAWFSSLLKKYQAQGSNEWALDRALADWEGVRNLTKVKIVEEGTDQIIKQLQKDKIVVMALTTQAQTLVDRTSSQLKSLNIDLNKTAPSLSDHYFMNGKGVLYRGGILFTNGTPKGAALVKLLDLIDLHPKHVVFINDKATHVKDLEGDVVARGIRFTGLRYSYGDERVANYRPEIAHIQWTQSSFDHILSDEEAEAFLKTQAKEPMNLENSTPEYLYKIVSPEQWQESLLQNQVVNSPIDKDFIHLAKEEQVPHVTQKFWNKKEYIILKLNVNKLEGHLIYEINPGGSTQYYHLYEGSIPFDAIESISHVHR